MAVRTAYLRRHPNAFWVISLLLYYPFFLCQCAFNVAIYAFHRGKLFYSKVDFGDFQFMRIELEVVRYVSGVATALLGSRVMGDENAILLIFGSCFQIMRSS